MNDFCREIRFKPAIWWSIYGLLISSIVGGIYTSSVHNPFVSDDFDFLIYASRELTRIFRYDPQFYHYVPVSLLVWKLLYGAFGADAGAFHIVGLIVHAANSLLVGALAWATTRSRIVVLTSGLLFVTSSLPYEVPLWATGLFTSLSTLFYLGSLLAYIQYQARRSRVRYGIFLAGFVLALLSHEQAITLIVACFLYRLLVVEERPWAVRTWLEPARLKSWLRDFIVPAAWVGAYIAMKLTLTATLVLVNQEGLKQTFWSFRISILRLLIPNASMSLAAALDDIGRPYGLLRLLWWGAIVAGVVVPAIRRCRANRFLLAWLLSHVAIMSYAVPMGSRHFYLPLAASAILIPNGLREILEFGWNAADKVLHFHGRLLPALKGRLIAGFLMLFCLVVSLGSIAQIQLRKAVWQEAAHIADHIIHATATAYHACPECTAIYLINLPDGLPCTETEVAYIFRNGIRPALRLAGIPRSVQIITLHTSDADWTWEAKRGSEEGLVQDAEINSLAGQEHNLVMQYFPALRMVQRVLMKQ